ncbi:MAG: c-type cytochrome [Aggregatilineales bacterium]
MPIAIQNRILIGVTFFVGILLLIGWIAINEPGRMDVFTAQYSGRSIENGAAIFLNNCSTCHGVDGKGTAGKAPALDNPMLFLKTNPAQDKQTQITDLTKKVSDAQVQVKTITDEQAQLAQLKQVLDADTDPNQKQTDQTAYDKLSAQVTRDQANLVTFQKNASDLQTQLDRANADLAALIQQGWDPARNPRLQEVGWGGTLKDYLADAVSAGRPLSGLYWPAHLAMPSWGQAYGGPLRPDQVDDVVAYVLNFQDQALKLTPKDVNEQFARPGAGGAGGATATPTGPTVFSQFPKSADQKVDNLGDLKGGNADNGSQLYQSLACAGCHLAGITGPITKGTYIRVVTQRLKDPQYTDLKTAEAYLAQSILYPNAYIVPSFQPNIMPQDFGSRITLQQLKDLIAYLETQNTP